MNYKEIENLENQPGVPDYSQSAMTSDRLKEYIEIENKKKNAKASPFISFYQNVINKHLKYDFKSALGETVYKNACDDAMVCLEIDTEFKRINSRVIISWLINALKFTDHIVLHYIQDVCKETPVKNNVGTKKLGIEKLRYNQLSKKPDEAGECGSILVNLYDLRNRFEHRTKTMPSGRQELIVPNWYKARKEVVKFYPLAMNKMLESYKKICPAHVLDS